MMQIQTPPADDLFSNLCIVATSLHLLRQRIHSLSVCFNREYLPTAETSVTFINLALYENTYRANLRIAKAFASVGSLVSQEE